jgi:hypothetical protein
MTTKDLKSRMSAAMSALKKAGSPATGVTVNADGSFTILTGTPQSPSMSANSDDDDWLAGIGDGQKATTTRKAGNA